MMKPKLLIVDDDEEIRDPDEVGAGEDYEVLLAGDRRQRSTRSRPSAPIVRCSIWGCRPVPATPRRVATLAGCSRWIRWRR